jgi:hypothetical protein
MRMAGSALGAIGDALVKRGVGANTAFSVGRGLPGMADFAMNSVGSLAFGAMLASQGANANEVGTAVVQDAGVQLLSDAVLGTVGNRLGVKFAPANLKARAMRGNPRRLYDSAANWGNMAKFGSIVPAMFTPNIGALNFQSRMAGEQQQQLLAGQGVAGGFDGAIPGGDLMGKAAMGTVTDEDIEATYMNALLSGASG